MRRLPVANPPSRFDDTVLTYEDGEAPGASLVVLEDATKAILAKNDSPDVGFRWSVNPYRGCYHGCAYCYARPTHEYLGLGAGTDFDRKIVVKPRAPELLRDAFEKKTWRGELVAFSGVTDCYQPLEASLRLTRGCLEVCAQYKNPVAVITKSPVIERDVDLLLELSRVASVRVSVSIPFWDEKTARAIEPWVTTPARRMRIVERLAQAGIPVGVGVSPVVPGLNDEDIARVLTAARDAGATHAFFVLLRLPGAVAPVFEQRLRAALPLRAERVLRRIKETRGGRMYDARFSVRGRGEGPYAQAIDRLFTTQAAKLGLTAGESWPTADTFRRPPRAPEPAGAQLGLRF
jgi:DNA repair photolyase